MQLVTLLPQVLGCEVLRWSLLNKDLHAHYKFPSPTVIPLSFLQQQLGNSRTYPIPIPRVAFYNCKGKGELFGLEF